MQKEKKKKGISECQEIFTKYLTTSINDAHDGEANGVR